MTFTAALFALIAKSDVSEPVVDAMMQRRRERKPLADLQEDGAAITCAGYLCEMQTIDPEHDGWRDGLCMDCVTEDDRMTAREEHADAEMRRTREDEP